MTGQWQPFHNNCCAQVSLQLDIEDINAFCQRQDALDLLKRLPKAQPSKPLSITASEAAPSHDLDSSHPGAAGAVA